MQVFAEGLDRLVSVGTAALDLIRPDTNPFEESDDLFELSQLGIEEQVAKDRIKLVMKGGVAYVNNLPVAELQPGGD